MRKCNHKPHARKKATYGSKRVAVWCDKCDAQLVLPPPSKKRARREGNVKIRRTK